MSDLRGGPGRITGGDRKMDGHLTRSMLEDARFMLDNGETMERAAARLGLLPDTLRKTLSEDAYDRRR